MSEKIHRFEDFKDFLGAGTLCGSVFIFLSNAEVQGRRELFSQNDALATFSSRLRVLRVRFLGGFWRSRQLTKNLSFS